MFPIWTPFINVEMNLNKVGTHTFHHHPFIGVLSLSLNSSSPSRLQLIERRASTPLQGNQLSISHDI